MQRCHKRIRGIAEIIELDEFGKRIDDGLLVTL
jgi:hypothetical protein